MDSLRRSDRHRRSGDGRTRKDPDRRSATCNSASVAHGIVQTLKPTSVLLAVPDHAVLRPGAACARANPEKQTNGAAGPETSARADEVRRAAHERIAVRYADLGDGALRQRHRQAALARRAVRARHLATSLQAMQTVGGQRHARVCQLHQDARTQSARRIGAIDQSSCTRAYSGTGPSSRPGRSGNSSSRSDSRALAGAEDGRHVSMRAPAPTQAVPSGEAAFSSQAGAQKSVPPSWLTL